MQSNAVRQVRVQSDTRTLLQALSATFTRPESVLGELLQNGRRAGATEISIIATDEVITVRDNGCGIADPSVLLSLAVSGWDDATKASDAPYGLGFLSTIFACEQLEVTSRGQRLSAKTQTLMECQPVEVEASADDGYTTIRMIGHKLGTVAKLHQILRNLAAGFPISVVVNDVPVDRIHAMDSGEWVESPMGWTRPQDVLNVDGRVGFFLQGLPISVPSYSGHYLAGPRIVHLRSPQVRGRLPERDSVLDPEAVAALVRQSFLDLARDALAKLSAEGDVKALCANAHVIEKLGAFELLEKHQVVPKAWLRQIEHHPQRTTGNEGTWWMGQPDSHLTFDQVRVRGLWNPVDMDDDGDYTESVLGYQYIRARGGLIAEPSTRIGAWLEKHFGIRDVFALDVRTVLTGVAGTHANMFREAAGVIACEAIALDHPTHGPATGGIQPESVLDADDMLVVTAGCDHAAAVKQFSEFSDGDDGEDEREASDAAQELSLIAHQLFHGEDRAVLLQHLVADLPFEMLALLKGQRFTVAIGEDRSVVVEALT